MASRQLRVRLVNPARDVTKTAVGMETAQ
jgi:hypothetical protein